MNESLGGISRLTFQMSVAALPHAKLMRAIELLRNRRCADGAQFPRVFTATACVTDCRSPCRSKLCAFTNLNNPRANIMTNQAMSYSISTLLTRNLQDVFGENDPARRRAAIDEIWTEDGVFYDPKTGVHRGRDEIDRIAGAIRATHPDFRYQPIAKPEELGNGGRVQWVSGRPGEAPAYAGTDFIIARDGRIAALYLFSTSYPELDSAERRS